MVAKLLSEKEVLDILGVSRTTLWREVKRHRFPEPIWIANRKKWKMETIQQHIDSEAAKKRPN